MELERSSSTAKHLLANFSQNLTDGVQIARILQPLSFMKLIGQTEERHSYRVGFLSSQSLSTPDNQWKNEKL